MKTNMYKGRMSDCIIAISYLVNYSIVDETKW